jgi:hypothetical protein
MSNPLRVLNPNHVNGPTVVYETTIETGSNRSARRVPKELATLVAAFPDFRVEVLTHRGWQPRRIAKVGRAYYTRTITTETH